jgi:5-methylcytosine-specific restriction endonuclease McrA
VRRAYDWAEIQRFYDEGNGFVACRRRFGCTHYIWKKAAAEGRLTLRGGGSPSHRRHDWAAIQRYYDAGHTVRQCIREFGFTLGSWAKARRRGAVLARAAVMPIHELLASPRRTRRHVKLRLLHAGMLVNRCQTCGLTSWLGQPLTMHLDHINGKRNDHRLENLRMLCPNCHSQTDTYGGRNRRRRSAS